MIDSGNTGTGNPSLRVRWIIVGVCGGVIGFSLAFLRLPTHSGTSVLGPATLVDRYTAVMTHPIAIIIEIILLCWVAFSKKLRDWRLVLFVGILGDLLGTLTRKLLVF
jgi:hypothetical protein